MSFNVISLLTNVQLENTINKILRRIYEMKEIVTDITTCEMRDLLDFFMKILEMRELLYLFMKMCNLLSTTKSTFRMMV